MNIYKVNRNLIFRNLNRMNFQINFLSLFKIKTMKKVSIFLVALMGGLFISCNSDDNNRVPQELRANDFVWKGLNVYYLWQQEVENLADNRFANQEQLNSFLRGYANPTDLFNSLLYQKGVVDRFSVIYDDYTVLEQILTGNNKNNGVDFGLFRKSTSSDQVIGWVRYLLPNSDASGKNIHRGDLFYAVNGVTLTLQNYQQLLNSNDSYTLHLADYDNGNYTPNGQTVSLTKYEYSENPVYYTNVYEINSHKIGYLVYNGFYGAYDAQLNNTFADFQAHGITDLILDLRYNSGGLVSSATHLASMITGQFTGEIFARQVWNEKVYQSFVRAGTEEKLINHFSTQLTNGNQINHLNLNRVYVLTTSGTASASELVINGLAPHINVIQIGGTTTGKNVGSVTVYDSPDFSSKNKNPDHKYAMQPLTFKIVNSTGFGEYQSGLEADVTVAENLADMKPLGDTDEIFLATAIAQITGTALPRPEHQLIEVIPVSDSKKLEPLKTEMYIEEIPQGAFDIRN